MTAASGARPIRAKPLPLRGVGIGMAIIDVRGRYRYMGSHNGGLGMIE